MNLLDFFRLCGLGCWRFLVFFGVFEMGWWGSNVNFCDGWWGLMMIGFGLGMGKRGLILLVMLGNKNFFEVLGLLLWRMILSVNVVRGIIFLFSFFDRWGFLMLRGFELFRFIFFRWIIMYIVLSLGYIEEMF